MRDLRSHPSGNGSATGVTAETAGGQVRAGAAVLAVGPAARGARAAALAADRDLLAHRPDRAGARRDRGDRLDRGRVHHRRPHADPLLPHHARRANRLRLGRRPARLRRRTERARRGRRGTWRPRCAAISSGSSPRSRGRRITHAWGGPIDVSPSHIPQIGTLPGAPVHFAFGYTGNGVGPSHLAGRTLAVARPGSARRATRACRSSNRAPAPGCRPSRSHGWAARWSARRWSAASTPRSKASRPTR